MPDRFVEIKKFTVHDKLLAYIMQVAEATSVIETWADIVVFTKTEDPAMCRMELIDTLDDDDGNGGKPHTVTVDVILEGIQKILNLDMKMPDSFAATGERENGNSLMPLIKEQVVEAVATNNSSMIDGVCADTIIQYGLFGELVY